MPQQFSPALRTTLETRLAEGLTALGQQLAPEAHARLIDYLELLADWNRAYNLTAVDDPLDMVERHLVDSLSIRPFIDGQRIHDVGTGAGLPGMVLAIAEPERSFVLVDSNGKKLRFLRQVVRRLDLDNVEPVQGRIESIRLDPTPDQIVARALAPLARMVEWLAPALDQGAALQAMKGALDADERAAVPDAYNVAIHRLSWPGQRAERCLAIVSRRERP
ncbi:MAG: 16S rRNA (guanine(527)-N(7))-methyltransferase RsmG [Gammaproteobacteria bacterium HGW-Gammaproteobacteria-8]|nr:MAG: 16S rRNA (guanine(527)-N(7))-methyltransferase RsmG [Gammaproteobacteria bacterium HGW-Gammaproteobacteria-8]